MRNKIIFLSVMLGVSFLPISAQGAGNNDKTTKTIEWFSRLYGEGKLSLEAALKNCKKFGKGDVSEEDIKTCAQTMGYKAKEDPTPSQPQNKFLKVKKEKVEDVGAPRQASSSQVSSSKDPVLPPKNTKIIVDLTGEEGGKQEIVAAASEEKELMELRVDKKAAQPDAIVDLDDEDATRLTYEGALNRAFGIIEDTWMKWSKGIDREIQEEFHSASFSRPTSTHQEVYNAFLRPRPRSTIEMVYEAYNASLRARLTLEECYPHKRPEKARDNPISKLLLKKMDDFVKALHLEEVKDGCKTMFAPRISEEKEKIIRDFQKKFKVNPYGDPFFD